MDHRGKGKFGVEVDHPKFGWLTQWYEKESHRNEYYMNLCRDPKFRDRKFDKVER